MQYVSTRGEAPELGFEDVLLTGLARDGGLYIPKTWPQISADELRGLRGHSYQDIAFHVVSKFIAGATPDAELKQMIAEAYATFGHPAVSPEVAPIIVARLPRFLRDQSISFASNCMATSLKASVGP